MTAANAPAGVPAVNGGPGGGPAGAGRPSGTGVPAGAGAHAVGTVPPGPADAELDGLRRHLRGLVADLDGPVRRIRLCSGDAVLEVEWSPPAPAAPGPEATPTVPPPPTAGRTVPPPAAPPPPQAAPARHAVRSPIVGTFYRAPEPGAAPFVSVGDRVHPGQVVGIVEAMKLMNEVTADRAGRVAELLADDGQPVEYDQPLLALDPA